MNFRVVFKSERVFCNFWSSSLMSFFSNFGKVWNIMISEISEHLENPVSEFSKLFWTFWTFPNFSELFWTFQNISKLFNPKTGFFDSKIQTLHSFFKIFKIDIQYWLIYKLFSKLKFPNFFPNFFAKILRVWKFCFFQKNSELQQPNISETRKNEKLGNFHLTQGLSDTYLSWQII